MEKVDWYVYFLAQLSKASNRLVTDYCNPRAHVPSVNYIKLYRRIFFYLRV